MTDYAGEQPVVLYVSPEVVTVTTSQVIAHLRAEIERLRADHERLRSLVAEWADADDAYGRLPVAEFMTASPPRVERDALRAEIGR